MSFEKTPQICSSCLTPLPEDLPEELCPNCLLNADTIATTVHTAGQTSYSAQFPVHATSKSSEDPDSIGVYKIMARLGEGGFGIVYHGEQREPIRREVALKIIKPGMDSRQIIRRFEAERQTLALMEHPNIAAVLDAGATENDRPFFVMELVRGEPITTYCDSRKLSIRERLALFIPVCNAVHHAHQKAVLHRDLKPSNILITEVDGKAIPKVIDFGISKALTPATPSELQDSLLHSSEGMIIGTPQYMSPEQAGAAQDLDTRSDIYTLGVILYELLTGQTPLSLASVKQATFHEILRIVREVDPQRPSSRVIPASELTKFNSTARKTEPGKLNRTLRGDLDWITLRALEKERERRYDSAAGLASDLERYLAGEPVEAGPPNAIYKFRKLVQRNRLAFGAAVAILLLLVAGIGVSTWQRNEAVTERNRAEKEKLAAKQLLVSAAWSSFHQALRLFHEADEESRVDATDMKSLGKSREGLLHLANAIKFDQDNPLLRERFGWEIVSRLESFRTIPELSITATATPGEIRFSKDGRRMLANSGGVNAAAWDANSGLPKPLPIGTSRLFAQGDTKLLCSDATNTVQTMESATGDVLAKLNNTGNIILATFSANEDFVVSVNDESKAVVWETLSGKPRFTFPMDQIFASSAGRRLITFNQDGTKLIAIAEATTAKLFDTQNGNLLATYQHDEPISSAAFSPDNRQILTTSKDHKAKLWDIATSALVKTFTHESGLNSGAFSPDGSMIATACDDFSARIWNIPIGKELTALAHTAQLDHVEFSPDGTFLLTHGGSRTAVVWDIATANNVASLEHESMVTSAHFSPDGSKIATTCEGRVIRTWDLATCLQKANLGRTNCATSKQPKITADSKTIISSKEEAIEIWNAKTGAPIAKIRDATSFHLSGNGNALASCGKDQRVSLWNPATGKLIETLPKEIAATLVTLNNDGSLLLASTPDSPCQLWAMPNHQLIASLGEAREITAMQFSPNQKVVVITQNDAATLWSLAGKELHVLPHQGKVTSVEFSPDSKRIVTASSSDHLRVWEVATGRKILELTQEGSSTMARFSPKSGTFIAGSSNGDVGIWSAPEGTQLLSLHLTDSVADVGFNSDGSRFVVASDKGYVWIYDTITGKEVAELPLNTPVQSAEYTPDGTSILTSDFSGAHQVWDVTTSQILSAADHATSMGDFQLIAQALSGRSISDDGEIRELSESDMVRTHEKLRVIAGQHEGKDMSKLVRWICHASPASPLAPYDNITRQEIFNALVEHGTEGDLRTAHILLPTHPEPLIKLSENWMKNDLDTMTEAERALALPADQARAAWLRAYAEAISKRSSSP